MVTEVRDRVANGVEARRWIKREPTAVIMQPTTLCNLDCVYCYLPDRRVRRDMAVDVAVAVAESIPEEWTKSSRLEIVWHGGEPLTCGHDRLGRLMEAFEPLRSAGQVQHVLQTNATLIDDAWCDLFQTFDVSVGVSIDGPLPADRNRIDRAGRAVHPNIVRGVEVLRRRGIGFSAIAVVSRDSPCDATTVLDFLRDLGCRVVGFNLEEREGVNTHDGTPSVDQARRFWREVFAWTGSHPDLPVREVQRIFDYLTLSAQHQAADAPHDLIPSVAYNGDVVVLSPELVGIRDERYGDFVAGNVLAEPLAAIVGRAAELTYVREFTDGVRRCKAQCEFFAFCQGSHAGNRYFEHGRFDVTETEHCRISTQALVRALHDVAYPERITT